MHQEARRRVVHVELRDAEAFPQQSEHTNGTNFTTRFVYVLCFYFVFVTSQHTELSVILGVHRKPERVNRRHHRAPYQGPEPDETGKLFRSSGLIRSSFADCATLTPCHTQNTLQIRRFKPFIAGTCSPAGFPAPRSSIKAYFDREGADWFEARLFDQVGL